MPYVLILFIAMPIIEIGLLLRVGNILGWLPTLLIVIVTAIIGSAMLRQQGLATLDRARQRMDSGELPAQQLLEGVFIMIGGVLLLTPGLVTDTCGFLCLIPITRQWLANKIASRAIVGFAGAGNGAGGGNQSAPSGASHSSGPQPGAGSAKPSSRQGNSSGVIIDGDFKRIDDE